MKGEQMTRFPLIALTALLPLMICNRSVYAGKLKTWTLAGPQAWDRAKLTNVVVGQEGQVLLGRHLVGCPELKANYVWAIVSDQQGGCYLATGGPGQVIHLRADGTLKVLFSSDTEQVLSLAVGPDGAVFAGTGPSGLVLRLRPGSQHAETWCTTGATYVWALCFDQPRNRLLAGTGPRGLVLAIGQETAMPTVWYATGQDHVLSLTGLTDGSFAAGTAPRGLVYRLDHANTARVWFQAPQSEVRVLLADGDAVWAGTCSSSLPRGRAITTAIAQPSTSSSNNRADLQQHGPDAGKEDVVAASVRPETPAGGKGIETFAPAPSLPPPGERENCVYRLQPDGSAREVFRIKGMVLTLAPHKGGLLVGTGGPSAQVFQVANAEQRVELCRLDHGQVLALLPTTNGDVWIATGDVGRLYRLSGDHVASGTLLSGVLDATALARWGLVKWQAELPERTRVSVSVRGGNVQEPDDTWTPWSAELTEPEAPNLPVTRFLQFRVTLSSDSPTLTPVLRSVTVRYQTLNLAPEVTQIDVPDVEATPLEQSKKLKIKWTAVDPNDDDLLFSVYCRKEGWQHWLELASDLDKREYEWDCSTLPTGRYQVRVLASDIKDNGAGAALTGYRTSGYLLISHDLPKVDVEIRGMEEDRAVIKVTATSSHVRLVSALVSHNGRKWQPLFPADGLFDDRQETLIYRTEPLRPGQQVLVFRVTDAFGNTGVADCVFVVREKQP
jgi:hypothetical protein